MSDKAVAVVVVQVGDAALSEALSRGVSELRSSGRSVTVVSAANLTTGPLFGGFDVDASTLENPGFAAAANRGISATDCPTVILVTAELDPDPGTLTALAESVESDRAVVAGPVLRVGTERWWGGSWNPRFGWARHHLTPRGDVAWLDGACLAFSRWLFERVGGFDESMFLYGEDLQFCLAARSVGGRVMVVGEEAAQASGMYLRSGAHGYFTARNELRLARRSASQLAIPASALAALCRSTLELTRAITRRRHRLHHLRQAVGFLWGSVDGLLGVSGPSPLPLSRWGNIPESVTLPPSAPRIALYYLGRRGGGARYTFELARALDHRTPAKVVCMLNADNELQPLFSCNAIEVVPQRVSGLALYTYFLRLLPTPWSLAAHLSRSVDHTVITMGNLLALPFAFTCKVAHAPLTVVVHDAHVHVGDKGKATIASVMAATRFADNVVTLSESVRNEIADRWRVPIQKIEIIPHGNFYEDDAPTLATPHIDCLLFGRLRAYKGVDLLLDAWELVHQQIPAAVLLLAGEGDPSPWRARLSQLVGSVQTDFRWIPDEQVPTLVSAAKVLVLPYLEASQSGVFGIAVALNVPVVACDVGGLREQADGRSNVTYVQPDARLLADALVEKILATRPELAPSGTGTWGVIADRFLSLAARASRDDKAHARLEAALPEDDCAS